MKIRVTQTHINEGLKTSVGYCPVALACKDATHFTRVDVDGYRVDFVGQNTFFQRPLPESARKFIHDFDRSVFVHPFEFEIEDLVPNL